MEKYKKAAMIVLLINVLLGLTACHMEESYKKFIIKDIGECEVDDYFVSEYLEFAKIEDVLIKPGIKEVLHGKYNIYISAYSEEEKKIIIKSISLKEEDKVLLTNNPNKNILLEKNEQGMLAGCIEGASFSDDRIEVSDGKKYNLVVQAVVEKEEGYVTKNIEYEIIIKGYKSAVMPV